MILIDWIEKNKEVLLDDTNFINKTWGGCLLNGMGAFHSAQTKVKLNESNTISGEDLRVYEKELIKLEDFKGLNIIIPLSPIIEKITMNNQVTHHIVGDVDVRIVDLTEDKKNLSWLFSEHGDVSDFFYPDFLYLYSIRIYRNMHTLGMRYCFVKDEEYAKNLKRTTVIDNMIK